MRINPPLPTAFFTLLLLLFSSSCHKEVSDQTEEAHLLPAALRAPAAAPWLETELLTSVRNATANFNSTTQAIKAGYVPDDHCVAVPGLGGMGYHWVNPSLVDATFDPMNPEVMLYATGPGGNLRLVAVEYIVINTGQDRPMFGDKPFDVRGTPIPAPHWSLHVWLHENNPAGIFRPFNPNISCP